MIQILMIQWLWLGLSRGVQKTQVRGGGSKPWRPGMVSPSQTQHLPLGVVGHELGCNVVLWLGWNYVGAWASSRQCSTLPCYSTNFLSCSLFHCILLAFFTAFCWHMKGDLVGCGAKSFMSGKECTLAQEYEQHEPFTMPHPSHSFHQQT